MRTVVIGEPVSSSTEGSSQQAQTRSYYYDADCIPPQQQAMQPTAAGEVPGTGPYPLGVNTGADTITYPPQPPAYAMYASYPTTATGVTVGAAVPAVAASPAAEPPAASAGPLASATARAQPQGSPQQ